MNGLVTDEMLDAAVNKAVEAGLLPRDARREGNSDYQDLIRYVLQAALDAAPKACKPRKIDAGSGRIVLRHRFADVSEAGHWMAGFQN